MAAEGRQVSHLPCGRSGSGSAPLRLRGRIKGSELALDAVLAQWEAPHDDRRVRRLRLRGGGAGRARLSEA
jgi:hypothetical protein